MVAGMMNVVEKETNIVETIEETQETEDQMLLRMKEENNFSFTPDEIKMLKKIMEETDPSKKEVMLKDALEDFKLNEEPKLIATLQTDDPRACYDIVDLNQKQKVDKSNYIDQSKMDYKIPRDEDAIRKGHKEDMPISFLSIKDGEIERGKQWYLSNFNKLPEEIAELLARYNWGDLKYQTKKKVKNDRKKAIRKGKKYEPLSNLEVKKGNFIVDFS
tara:strand:- start:1177 stop:1827 length:651 start_codon:yes stop_codon:yes gene_type:complete